MSKKYGLYKADKSHAAVGNEALRSGRHKAVGGAPVTSPRATGAKALRSKRKRK